MTDAAPTTILIADDEAPIRLLVRVNLEAEGFRVLEAADGNKTLEAVEQELPDLILLDVMMPYRDGWEVAEHLLGDPRTADLPIIFLTARADLRDHERGLTTGALQYITKPFNPRSLAPTIMECLRTARAGGADQARTERLQSIRELQVAPE